MKLSIEDWKKVRYGKIDEEEVKISKENTKKLMDVVNILENEYDKIEEGQHWRVTKTGDILVFEGNMEVSALCMSSYEEDFDNETWEEIKKLSI